MKMTLKNQLSGIIFFLAMLTVNTGMGQDMNTRTDPVYNLKSTQIIPFEVVDSITAPGGDCNDLSWDGDNLWVTDGLSRKIYMMDDSAGTVVKSFPFPATSLWCEGLTFNGNYLWACTWDVPNGEGSRLYKLDRAFGDIISNVEYTDDYYGNFPHGLTYRGSSIWASNAKTETLDEIDPATGNLLRTLPASPGTVGVAYHNGFFWTTDVDNSRINKIDQNTGDILGYIPMPVDNCRGLTWQDDFLWTVSPSEQIMYKIDVGSLQIEEIKPAKIKIYPNPGKGIINLSLDGSLSTSFILSIYDVAGKEVYSHEYPPISSSSNELTINLEGIPAGSYLLKIQSESGHHASKLIIRE